MAERVNCNYSDGRGHRHGQSSGGSPSPGNSNLSNSVNATSSGSSTGCGGDGSPSNGSHFDSDWASAGRSGSNSQRGDDSGMVTLELALAIPMLLIVCVSLVWVVNVGRVDALAQDASRAAVRELVRGGDAGKAVAAAHRVLPDSRVNTSVSRGRAHATVAIELRGPAPLLSRISHRIRARSVGSLEAP